MVRSPDPAIEVQALLDGARDAFKRVIAEVRKEAEQAAALRDAEFRVFMAEARAAGASAGGGLTPKDMANITGKVVRELVDEKTAPIAARMEDLEQRVAALEEQATSP